MIYSLNLDIYERNSGSEHAAFARQELFNLKNLESKIVTKNYNRFLDRNISDSGLKNDDVLNMYDYFQEVVDINIKKQEVRTLPDIDLKEFHLLAHGPAFFTIEKNGYVFGKATVMPKTVGLIDQHIFLDAFGNKTRIDNYDWRGFKSSTEVFDEEGNLLLKRYFDLKQNTKIETKFLDGQISAIYLVEDNKYFDNEEELFNYFLKKIVSKKDVLISDRHVLDPLMIDLDVNKKIVANHGMQTPDVTALESDSDNYPIYDIFRNPLEKWAKDFDSVVVPTEKQKADLEKISNLYFGGAARIKVAADNFSKIDEVENENRTSKVVYAGFITENKRLELAIEIFNSISNKIPDAIFEIYGYFENNDLSEKIKKLADSNPKIKFFDYVTSKKLIDAYKSAKIFLQTTKSDAFASAMIDALSLGTPVIATDSLYGPRSIVENDYRSNNIAYLENKILEILSDDQSFKLASKTAIETAKKYSSDVVFSQWEEILK